MYVAREVERKYEVPVGLTIPDVPGLAVGEPAVHDLSAVYWDTEDLRLIRHRVTLRRRTGGTDAGWHVKRPAEGADAREEIHHPLGRAGRVPAKVAAEVRAITRGAKLEPVVTLSTTRTEWPVVDDAGTVLALIADDTVSAAVAGAPAPTEWHELEVELVDGDATLLKRIDKALRKVGAVRSASVSKLARALDGRVPEPAPPVAPEGSAAAAVNAYLAEQRDTLIGYDPRVRRDEPDSVHKMRVATRRSRSALKTFGAFGDRAAADALRVELKWLADVLGEVRDAEVLAAGLDGAVAAEEPELVVGPVASRLTGALGARTSKGRRAVISALDGPRYAALLDAFDAYLATPPTRAGANPATTELPKRVRKSVAKVDRLLAAADRAEGRSPTAEPVPGAMDRDTALHEARKAAKQARYAGEAVRDVVGEPAKALAAAMESVQEVLGAHHDTVVTRELLRTAAMQAYAAKENTFTYGVLHARQAALAEKLEAQLPTVLESIRKGKVRRWLG